MSTIIWIVSSHTNLLFFWKWKLGLDDERESGDTSENAGAVIFLYFFHSSPSEAIIFAPKINNP
jgi:hypothetical protein